MYTPDYYIGLAIFFLVFFSTCGTVALVTVGVSDFVLRKVSK